MIEKGHPISQRNSAKTYPVSAYLLVGEVISGESAIIDGFSQLQDFVLQQHKQIVYGL